LEEKQLPAIDELKAKFEELKTKSEVVDEPVEPMEADPEEDNSVWDGYDFDDKYF
jgi:hypothetical protein